jgi:hypothetical protein
MKTVLRQLVEKRRIKSVLISQESNNVMRPVKDTAG